MGNQGLISFQQVWKRHVGKSGEEIVEVAGVVLNGARGLPLADKLLNEGPHGWVLRHQGATAPIRIGHSSPSPCMRSNALSVYHKQSLSTYSSLVGIPRSQSSSA